MLSQCWWQSHEIKVSILSAGSREESFLASSWLLVVVGNPWHPRASDASVRSLFLSSHCFFFSVCLCVQRFLLIRPRFRVYSNSVRLPLNLIMSAKMLFAKILTITDTRDQDLNILSWEHNLVHKASQDKQRHDFYQFVVLTKIVLKEVYLYIWKMTNLSVNRSLNLISKQIICLLRF